MSDRRFQSVKVMIHTNNIKTFQEIFDLIPKTYVANELHANNKRITKLIQNPLGLTLKEIDTLASVFGCTTERLIELIRAQ